MLFSFWLTEDTNLFQTLLFFFIFPLSCLLHHLSKLKPQMDHVTRLVIGIDSRSLVLLSHCDYIERGKSFCGISLGISFACSGGVINQTNNGHATELPHCCVQTRCCMSHRSKVCPSSASFTAVHRSRSPLTHFNLAGSIINHYIWTVRVASERFPWCVTTISRIFYRISINLFHAQTIERTIERVRTRAFDRVVM